MESPLIAGRYEILRELGAGSGGTVYLVHAQEVPESLLALKSLALPEASAEVVAAFRRECKLLKKLSHPHLAPLLDYGEDQGQLFYVTEFVEGDDFVRACQEKDWNAIFVLIAQACRALHYLHSQQIIHRDIKPANLLVGKIHQEGQATSMERLRLKLIDFGLAVSAKSRSKMTQTTGTLSYMAPEVLAQEAYDQRADLYSFGVVLYEMALDRLPVAKKQTFSHYLEALHRHEIDLSPLQESDEIPKGIIAIIKGLVVKDLKQRIDDALKIIQLLNKVEGEDFPLSEKEVPPRQASPRRRRAAARTKPRGSEQAQTSEETLEALLSLVRSGERNQAWSFIESKLPHFKEERNFDLVEKFYGVAGHVLIEQGRYPEAQVFLKEMAEHPSLAGQDSIERVILEIQLAYREGNLAQADKRFRSISSNQLNKASPEQKTRLENYAALILQGLKKYAEAAVHYEKAAEFAAQTGRKDHQLSLLVNAGGLQQEQGQWKRAYKLMSQAEALARDTNNTSTLATILNNLGNLYLYFGRLSQAEEALEESLSLAEEQGLQPLVAYNLYLLTVGEQGKGNWERVAHNLQRALKYANDLGESQPIFQAGLAQGYYYLEKGKNEACEKSLKSLRVQADTTKQAPYGLQIDWLEAKLRIKQESAESYPVSQWLATLHQDAVQRKLKNNLWKILNDEGDLARLQGDNTAAQQAYLEALKIIDGLKKVVPKKFHQSFLRDRKKEKIRRALESLQEKKQDSVSLPTPTISFEQWADVNRRLLLHYKIDPLLEEILDAALALTDAERGFVILSEHQDLDIRAARNFDKQNLNPESEEFSYTIASEVMQKGKSMVSLDAPADKRFAKAESVHALNIRSVLCVPLLSGQRTIGLIYLDNRFRPGVLKTDHIRMIEALADQASLTLEHTRLHRENREWIEELKHSKQVIENLNARLEQELNDTTSHLEALRESMQREHEEISLRYSYDKIIGKSPQLKKVLTIVDRVVESNSPVFIYGESGTGKEIIANALHYNSPRKSFPFITENCAALAENILESELFGHVRGAFTGADKDKIGLFQMAHCGTLFLDEVGDMSPNMQAKLLRVLQEGEVRRVGGREYRKVDIRVITASHRDIRKMVAANEFRQDLYYRLNVVRIDLPPLRDRGEDVLLLADHFLEQMAQAEGKPKPKLSKGTVRALLDYPWPGNIRELHNEMQRAFILGADIIRPSMLSPQFLESAQERQKVSAEGGLGEVMAPIEKRTIMQALEQCRGNKVKAAQLLKINRRTLYLKLKQYEIPPHWGKAGQAKGS